MNPILTIAGRELRSYFDSPIAYIVVVSFLLVAGWMFFGSFFLMERADMRMFFAPSPFSPSMLLVIIVPALTMRLVAEEKKSGTIEFLTTMPVTDTQVILGKFLGAFALLSSAILTTLVYAFCVSLVGDLDWGPVIAGYVGLLLFVASMTAIGLLCSTLTSNQIVAFIIGFLVCAGLYFVYWLQFFMPQSIGPIVEYLSLSFHLDNLARGVIDTRDVLYYLSVTCGALFLSVQSMNRQHA
jgi:ABC-2 type transport system permease protein